MTIINPAHKSVTTYYATLKELASQNVSHEMGLRRAFQQLLAETAKLHDWTLITEDAHVTRASSPASAPSTVRPDATLRDKNTLPRGFWEAKDTNDSLTREIARKSAKGYSLMNTIFEDTQTAILYRPFFVQNLYFAEMAIDELGQMPKFFPTSTAEEENCAICATGIGAERPFAVMASKRITDLNFFGPGTVPQWFPFYVYDEDGSNRRENITDWALTQFHDHYHDKKISKWDIFYYVYGILHHPAYREKFADNLKRELPRIPFAPPCNAGILPASPPAKNPKSKTKNPPVASVSSVVENSPASGFHAFSKAGKKLADLHLNYESAREFPLTEIITPGTPRSPRVESKMKFNKDKSALDLNPSLRLTGIPPETFLYKLGNRSALDWIVDQYQVYTDPRTDITSDPNAWGEEHDNPEYIPQLIAKIITVSLETQRVIESLPKDFAESEKS